MNMEHDVIMEEKVEQLSERLEGFVLDAFISVLLPLVYFKASPVMLPCLTP